MHGVPSAANASAPVVPVLLVGDEVSGGGEIPAVALDERVDAHDSPSKAALATQA